MCRAFPDTSKSQRKNRTYYEILFSIVIEFSIELNILFKEGNMNIRVSLGEDIV